LGHRARQRGTDRSLLVARDIFGSHAFFTIWLFSILDNSQRAMVDRAGFDEQRVRSEIGIGAYHAPGH